jgi:hypothetical protein
MWQATFEMLDAWQEQVKEMPCLGGIYNMAGVNRSKAVTLNAA